MANVFPEMIQFTQCLGRRVMSTARRKIVNMLTKLQQFLKVLVSLHLKDAKLETVITLVQDKYTEYSILYSIYRTKFM